MSSTPIWVRLAAIRATTPSQVFFPVIAHGKLVDIYTIFSVFNHRSSRLGYFLVHQRTAHSRSDRRPWPDLYFRRWRWRRSRPPISLPSVLHHRWSWGWIRVQNTCREIRKMNFTKFATQRLVMNLNFEFILENKSLCRSNVRSRWTSCAFSPRPSLWMGRRSQSTTREILIFRCLPEDTETALRRRRAGHFAI